MSKLVNAGLVVLSVMSLMTVSNVVYAGEEPGVEIRVYDNTNTETKDDLALLGILTRLTESTPCWARLTGNPKADMAVVLINPDSRLGISPSELTLPQSKEWVAFSISGSRISEAVGDAKIEVHQDFAYGDLKTTHDVTVCDLVNPSIIATPEDPYEFRTIGANRVFGPPAGGKAISVTAKVTLRPSGLDSTAPQLAPLKLAIQQTLKAGGLDTFIYSPPVVDTIDQWQPGAVVGQTYNIPAYRVQQQGLESDTNDTQEGVDFDPFYDPPVALSSNGETSVTITDAPIPTFPPEGYLGVMWQENGVDIVLVAYYEISSARMQRSFEDHAVLALYKDGQMLRSNLMSRFGLASTTWGLNVSSDTPGQRATGGSSGEFTGGYVDRPVSNDSTVSHQEFDYGGTTWPKTARQLDP